MPVPTSSLEGGSCSEAVGLSVPTLKVLEGSPHLNKLSLEVEPHSPCGVIGPAGHIDMLLSHCPSFS